MNELTTGWKIFRVVCIVQMILVAFVLVMAIAEVFYRSNFLYRCLAAGCYVCMFWLLYLGLSLLNDNYPDVPLSQLQKRKFNWLFLLNFLFIAFLFARLVSAFRLYQQITAGRKMTFFTFHPLLVVYMLMFILHLVFLAGMFVLRQIIYTNAIRKWHQQFGETPSPLKN